MYYKSKVKSHINVVSLQYSIGSLRELIYQDSKSIFHELLLHDCTKIKLRHCCWYSQMRCCPAHVNDVNFFTVLASCGDVLLHSNFAQPLPEHCPEVN